MTVREVRFKAGYLFIVMCIYLTSCISSKELALYQADSPGKDTMSLAPRFTQTINIGDVLSVQVSSLSPEAATFFNPYTTITMAERAGSPQQVTPTTPMPYTPWLPGE